MIGSLRGLTSFEFFNDYDVEEPDGGIAGFARLFLMGSSDGEERYVAQDIPEMRALAQKIIDRAKAHEKAQREEIERLRAEIVTLRTAMIEIAGAK